MHVAIVCIYAMSVSVMIITVNQWFLSKSPLIMFYGDFMDT